ncbi:MAG: hypothetical protein HQL54_12565 [Magnetococcales bacterium]|nr:hypothetical protein [Magnetococcales bacterium]
MTSAQFGVNRSEIQAHKLFVEGDNNSLDATVLKKLLPRISIVPLGPSHSIKNAAQALVTAHPNYYFLVDRDYHDDDFVEQSWRCFPDPDKYNLLIWRKRELENYFLDPNYLMLSSYLKKGVDRAGLERLIIKHAQQRLYLDVANQVIISMRESLKKSWISLLSNPDDFPSKEVAIERLEALSECVEHLNLTQNTLGVSGRVDSFNAILQSWSGGSDQLAFGVGDWQNQMSGKKILNKVITDCFRVPKQDDPGWCSQKFACKAVVKELLNKDLHHQPDDFQKLYNLIQQRIASDR